MVKQVMNLEFIGSTLKQHRLSRAMSIRELSSISGIASSTISQIETGKNSPNLLTLKAICDALDIPVFSLFMEEDQTKIRLVRKDDREPFVRNTSKGAPVKESLIIQGKNEMYGGVVEMPPHTDSGAFSHHGGEEFVFVLEGTINFYLEGHNEYELHEEDTLYYPNYIGHRWENKSDSTVKMLMVSTSPYNF
ncbi:helix-turn-helix domain-containing protein [Anaerotignum sp. MSJ-24]|uniref:helix-turn-helix domain-containing protein n=1 Tax=Anaerotignum sp. MSJ-24 TaxID=2841521 RepID=UPI00209F8F38|nr:XRE family transcriptional regulator [Anaerotignum sp. MSJ-24]